MAPYQPLALVVAQPQQPVPAAFLEALPAELQLPDFFGGTQPSYVPADLSLAGPGYDFFHPGAGKILAEFAPIFHEVDAMNFIS